MAYSKVRRCGDCGGEGGHERLDKNGVFFDMCRACKGWGVYDVPELREAVRDARQKSHALN